VVRHEREILKFWMRPTDAIALLKGTKNEVETMVESFQGMKFLG
jgi:hypothetical protein